MERLMEKWPILVILALLALILVVVEIRSVRRDRAPVYAERARVVVLRVARSVSRKISENDEGVLTWQGDRFEKFEQQQEGSL